MKIDIYQYPHTNTYLAIPAANRLPISIENRDDLVRVKQGIDLDLARPVMGLNTADVRSQIDMREYAIFEVNFTFTEVEGEAVLG